MMKFRKKEKLNKYKMKEMKCFETELNKEIYIKQQLLNRKEKKYKTDFKQNISVSSAINNSKKIMEQNIMSITKKVSIKRKLKPSSEWTC